jgi:hypothetical protein
MHAPEYAAGGPDIIVLNKFRVNPVFPVPVPIINLEKESAGIFKDPGLDKIDPLQIRFRHFHKLS